ncbi:MAG: histidinol-phosphatase [Synergistaceae bacterium]|nr:histidinol-phosphatase [Synergistaceae bacterium]
MILADFHVHSCFCDGHDKPEEIVQAAISLGMKKLGFSGHSYTPFDEEPCMSVINTEKYKLEIARLKREYKSKLEILCGVEQDYYSEMSTSDYDFVIGSVHYVNVNGKYHHVDSSPEKLAALIHDCNDDAYLMTEKYFALAGDVINKTGADIIGHFDLVTKLNADSKFFDEGNSRYVQAWKSAADRLIMTGKPFEINTGAISRGYKTVPYPSRDILGYLAENHCSVILSSDSHSKENLMYKFPECESLAESLGLKITELS